MTNRLDTLRRALSETTGNYILAALDRQKAQAALALADEKHTAAGQAHYAAMDALTKYAADLEPPGPGSVS